MSNTILMLITNLGAGGAQRVYYNHALEFCRHYQIEEVVFDDKEDDRLYNSGLPLRSLNIKAAANPLEKLTYFFKRATALDKIIKTQNASLVISHMDGANWVNALASKKVKKILVVHGTVLHDKAQAGWKNYLRKKVLIPYLYNMADLTVAVSEGIQYELKEFCGVKKVVSIPNFFDIDEITAKSNQPLPDSLNDIFNSYPVLVTSGRFHIQKNQSALLKLFAKLKEVNPVVKLFLLGDGELRKSLIDQAKELGLKTYAVWDGTVVNEKYDVYFMGYLENPFAYLKKSTLFLFPSGWEGFPMALCEAMISGVVVLTADCPTGPRQILAPGTYDHQYNLKEAEYTNAGVLLPMADKNNFEAQWISAIQNLLNNEHLRINMAKNARHLMQAYDKKKIIGQWLDIINQVLNGVEQ